MRRPIRFSHRPGRGAALGFGTMNVEITPEPSEDERAAILAALSVEQRSEQNLSLEEDPEP